MIMIDMEMPKDRPRQFLIYPDGRVVGDGWNTHKAVEVKRGKLIDPNPYGECSICGFLIDIRDNYRYCPSCGAKMESEPSE